MRDLFLGLSSDFLYYQNKPPQKIAGHHQPYFLVLPPKDSDAIGSQKMFVEQWKKNRETHSVLSKIVDIGPVESYRSFCDFAALRNVFKIFTNKSYVVPEVSDYVFFEHGLYTCEHDMPYQQRALVDLAADDKAWIFDTGNEKKTLKVLVYDIEMTEFEPGKTGLPVDMIGWASFDIQFESQKNLEEEEFRFEILDCPTTWESIEVRQLMAKTVDEEFQNLIMFLKTMKSYDVISGHNILGFDHVQVQSRLEWLMKNRYENLSNVEKKIGEEFLQKWSRTDRSFHFGVGSEVVQFYPSSFDTYIAARKFYPYLDEYGLKNLALFLGIHIPDRIYLTPAQIKLDEQTLKYNRQDIQEQLGVTLHLIQQALPLAFTTCMPFDMLLPSGAVSIWDHMALIRGAKHKKIMPPICRVRSVAQTLVKDFKGCNSKNEIVQYAKKKHEQLSKDVVRVVKYGVEMPDWVLYPYVIFNEKATDADEMINYHFPGGMTIKPDKDAKSDFIPWYYVVVADVGAMYPTILKAMNVGADTVRFARKDEEVDEWIWLKKIPSQFFDTHMVNWRPVTEHDSYADKGYMIGIKIDTKPGVVNLAMTGILNLIAQIKAELKESSRQSNYAEYQRLKMMYQSLKGVRNAGTHGILSAPAVTGRQFNLWGAAAITTKGQMILADTLSYLQNKKIRVVYGDTDGIYMGCSQTMSNIAQFAEAMNISIPEVSDGWLTRPTDAFAAIEECNKRWQKELDYTDFELEPETHDAMVFVKHKNYLIFDEMDNNVEMVTKGNNFKGSDKPNIARLVLKTIMMNVLKQFPSWNDEDTVRSEVKKAILDITNQLLADINLSTVNLDDLTLVQSVQPANRYKRNQDGSQSTFGKRAEALEKLLGERIRSRIKLKFVVTKQPLPGIPNPSKSGVKPIDYMFPVDHLKGRNQIDLDWYKKMIVNYVQGAFGLSSVITTKQQGLDNWM